MLIVFAPRQNLSRWISFLLGLNRGIRAREGTADGSGGFRTRGSAQAEEGEIHTLVPAASEARYGTDKLHDRRNRDRLSNQFSACQEPRLRVSLPSLSPFGSGSWARQFFVRSVFPELVAVFGAILKTRRRLLRCTSCGLPRVF